MAFKPLPHEAKVAIVEAVRSGEDVTVMAGRLLTEFAGVDRDQILAGAKFVRDPLSRIAAQREARQAPERAWIEANLGDVPYDRIVGATCHDNPQAWTLRDDICGPDGSVGAISTEPSPYWVNRDGTANEHTRAAYDAAHVPTESLGRDA